MGWQCPTCTYVNTPLRPGCEMCCTERPVDYAVPEGYRPDAEEAQWLQKEKEAALQYEQVRPTAGHTQERWLRGCPPCG